MLACIRFCPVALLLSLCPYALAQEAVSEVAPCYIDQIEEIPGKPPKITHTEFYGDFAASQNVNAPVLTRFPLLPQHAKAAKEHRLYLNRLALDGRILPTIPVQYYGSVENALLSFMMPVSQNETMAFILVEGDSPVDSMLTANYDRAKAWVDIREGKSPVLRYYHGAAPLPQGVDPVYTRGDYIGALYGPQGQNLLDDFPEDHPHHRGVNWAWATVQWKGAQHDLFWGKGIWARPVKPPRCISGPVYAFVEAESEWRWEDETALVHERVVLIAYAAQEGNRYLDISIELTSLVEDLEFCGRLEEGYSGFNLRMAPGGDQAIHFPAEEATGVEGGWADYSAKFNGTTGIEGVTVLQHPDNPGYPHAWRKYPDLNFFQPLWPGGALIPFPKGDTIRLQYRLWVHGDAPQKATLNDLLTAYTQPMSSTTTE